MPIQRHRDGLLKEYYSNAEFRQFFTDHGIVVTDVSIDSASWERHFLLYSKPRSLPMDLPAEECLRLVRWDLKHRHGLPEGFYNIAFAERYATTPPQTTRTPRIVIVQEGGCVQTVLADAPVDVLVLDYDTEGDEDNPNLVQVPQIDGINEGHTETALFLPHPTYIDPDRVHELYNLKRPCLPVPALATESNASNAASSMSTPSSPPRPSIRNASWEPIPRTT